MLFSEASGRKVVSTTTAETVGKLHDYVIDPSGPRVAALLLKKGDGDTLRWSDIQAFGTDAVTVEAAEKVTKGGEDLAALLDKRNQLHKKRVLTTAGDEIGSVRDIDFDPQTGTVTALVLDDTEVAGTRLIGVGSYAVVVSTDTAPASPDAPAVEAVTSAAAARPAAPPAAATGVPQAVPSEAVDSQSEPPTAPDLSGAQRASYPPV